jgi:hypothetical protein
VAGGQGRAIAANQYRAIYMELFDGVEVGS